MAMGYVTLICKQLQPGIFLDLAVQPLCGHVVTRSPRRPGLQPAFLAPGRHRVSGSLGFRVSNDGAGHGLRIGS